MSQDPKLPMSLPAPRLRDSVPRFQRQEATGEDTSRAALRALVQLLARQAAEEVVEDSGAPAVH